MSSVLPVAPALMHHSTLSGADMIEFLITGGVVVYGTLSLLAVLGVLGGYLFVYLEKRFGDVDDPEARRLERQRKVEEQEEQDRIAAVICAAVSEVVGDKHRVVAYKAVGETNWSMQGRSQHHSSHKLR